MAAAQTVHPPSFGRRVWEFPITRILAFLLLLGALTAALGFALKAMLPQGTLAPDTTQLLGEGVLATATLLAFWAMKRRADKETADEAGLPVRGIFSESAIGLLIGGGVFSAAVGLMTAFRVFTIAGVNAHYLPLVPLVTFLLVGLFEEVVFRGYVFQTLERRWGSGIALAGSGLFFGLAHLTNQKGVVGPVLISFEASILMTAAYLLTRRLWLPIGIHWGWNLLESSVYGLTDSGTHIAPAHILFAGRLSGPTWLTGGAFGPEAGLACLICGTYAGILLLRMAIRKGHWRGLPTAPPTLVTANTEGNTP